MDIANFLSDQPTNINSSFLPWHYSP